MAKVVFENVTKVFDEEIAVGDLSFECTDGEFFVLLGPSGAGKTTIMNLIAGLENVTHGNILIDGKIVNDVEPRFRDIAYAFENYSLYPHLNVYENIGFPLKSPIRKGHFTQKQIDDLVKNVARTLQIDQLLDRGITQLSGGQRQRVALARTLTRNPAVYLLDEAIAHLDAKLRHSIRATLKGYQEERRVTTLYATPDQLDAVAMSDRMLVIQSGKLQQVGTADEVYRFPTNQFVATLVGYPQMNIFPARLISEGNKMLARFNGIDLQVPGKIKRVVEKKAKDPQVRLGIRPIDMTLKPMNDRELKGLSGKIRMVEHYGDYVVYSAQSEGHLIKVKMEAEIAVNVGEKVCLEPDMDAVYIFTGDGEKTIWPVRD